MMSQVYYIMFVMTSLVQMTSVVCRIALTSFRKCHHVMTSWVNDITGLVHRARDDVITANDITGLSCNCDVTVVNDINLMMSLVQKTSQVYYIMVMMTSLVQMTPVVHHVAVTSLSK